MGVKGRIKAWRGCTDGQDPSKVDSSAQPNGEKCLKDLSSQQMRTEFSTSPLSELDGPFHLALLR